VRVFFDFDKSVVKPEYFDEVRKLAEELKARPDTAVIIEGHTCNIGTEEYNLGLGARRANSIAKLLHQEYGIALERITAQSFGESQPLADNSTREGRERNRRIYAYIEND
jgi:OmpA-OmpF porin, OOP family